jgi:hypothetical protein
VRLAHQREVRIANDANLELNESSLTGRQEVRGSSELRWKWSTTIVALGNSPGVRIAEA